MLKHEQLFAQFNITNSEEFDAKLRDIPLETRNFLLACFERQLFSIDFPIPGWEEDMILLVSYVLTDQDPRQFAKERNLTSRSAGATLKLTLRRFFNYTKGLAPELQSEFPQENLPFAPFEESNALSPKPDAKPGRKTSYTSADLLHLRQRTWRVLEAEELAEEYQKTQRVLDSLVENAYVSLSQANPPALISFGAVLDAARVRRVPPSEYSQLQQLFSEKYLIANRKLGRYYVIAAKDLQLAVESLQNDPLFREPEIFNSP